MAQQQANPELVDRLSTVLRKLPGASSRASKVEIHAASIASLHEQYRGEARFGTSAQAPARANEDAAQQLKKLRNTLKWFTEDLSNLGATAHEAVEAERGELTGNQAHLSYLPMILTAVIGDLEPVLERAEARIRASSAGATGESSSGSRRVQHALEIGWRARFAYFDLTGILASMTRHSNGSFHQCLKDIFDELGIEVNSKMIVEKLFSGKLKPPAPERPSSDLEPERKHIP